MSRIHRSILFFLLTPVMFRLRVTLSHCISSRSSVHDFFFQRRFSLTFPVLFLLRLTELCPAFLRQILSYCVHWSALSRLTFYSFFILLFFCFQFPLPVLVTEKGTAQYSSSTFFMRTSFEILRIFSDPHLFLHLYHT